MFSFQRRLILAHWAVIVIVVTGVAFAAWWELSRIAHRQLDAALLALAETEAGMLLGSKSQPIRVHEKPTGTAPPSLVRLDRLVQIVDAQGDVLARSANLGTTRLPTSPVLLGRLAQGETVFETLQDFSEEPLRMVSLPIHSTPGAPPLVIQVAGSLDDVNRILDSAVVLFVGLAVALLLAVGTGAGRLGQVGRIEREQHVASLDFIAQLLVQTHDAARQRRQYLDELARVGLHRGRQYKRRRNGIFRRGRHHQRAAQRRGIRNHDAVIFMLKGDHRLSAGLLGVQGQRAPQENARHG